LDRFEWIWLARLLVRLVVEFVVVVVVVLLLLLLFDAIVAAAGERRESIKFSCVQWREGKRC